MEAVNLCSQLKETLGQILPYSVHLPVIAGNQTKMTLALHSSLAVRHASLAAQPDVLRFIVGNDMPPSRHMCAHRAASAQPTPHWRSPVEVM
jgi:hypothetical protein